LIGVQYVRSASYSFQFWTLICNFNLVSVSQYYLATRSHEKNYGYRGIVWKSWIDGFQILLLSCFSITIIGNKLTYITNMILEKSSILKIEEISNLIQILDNFIKYAFYPKKYSSSHFSSTCILNYFIIVIGSFYVWGLLINYLLLSKPSPMKLLIYSSYIYKIWG